MSDNEMEVEEQEKEDLRNDKVVTKYRCAADIVNDAIAFLMKECAPGKKVVDLCELGDKFIVDRTSKIYNKGKVEKGIGFPTCISLNNVVGHFSPLFGDETTLSDGDLIKIDLGVHIDGYVAVGGHCFVLGGESKVSGPKANVLAAAHAAAECAIRLLRAGNKNHQITEAIAKVADAFKCNPVAGVLSHQMNRFVFDGEKVITNRVDPEQKVEEFEFEPNEVYAIDIVMSTAEGNPKESVERTTVYQRALETTYSLKLKASRSVFSEIKNRFPTFPFTMRAFNEKKARFGIVECSKHDLVHSFPVLIEKQGAFVAHLKFTALLLPTGTVRITGLPINAASLQTDYQIKDQGILELLATSVGKKKKKNKKKKKKKPASGTASMDTSA